MCIRDSYTHEEIAMAEDFLCPERDELFTYSGLDLLLKRLSLIHIFPVGTLAVQPFLIGRVLELYQFVVPFSGCQIA